MRKYFFLFFLFSLLSYSQKIQLIDSVNRKVIPFANATFFINSELVGGDYSDINGVLNLRSKLKLDSIKLSAIGYKDLVVDYSTKIDTIILIPTVYMLDEVIVVQKDKKILTLGLADTKKVFNLGIGKGLEEVVFIENNFKVALPLKSFLFNIKKTKKRIAVKVHFYKLNPNKFEPNEEILTESIIYYLEEKTKGYVEINVQEYGIELPIEGAFVGVEALGVVNDENNGFKEDEDYSTDLLSFEVNSAINKPISFIRNRFKSTIWESSEKLKQQLLNIKSPNYPNASFGIKVLTLNK